MLDAEVVYEGKNGELRLIAAEQYLPNYTVSSYYASLLQNECLSAEEREYFQGKLRAARWIIECVDRAGQCFCVVRVLLCKYRARF